MPFSLVSNSKESFIHEVCSVRRARQYVGLYTRCTIIHRLIQGPSIQLHGPLCRREMRGLLSLFGLCSLRHLKAVNAGCSSRAQIHTHTHARTHERTIAESIVDHSAKLTTLRRILTLISTISWSALRCI